MTVIRAESASPPKNTFGLVETNVLVSDRGMFHRVELECRSPRSNTGNALSSDSDQQVSQGMSGPVRTRAPGCGGLFRVVFGLHILEGNADELAVTLLECTRHHELRIRDILVEWRLPSPTRAFHFLEAGAHDQHVDGLRQIEPCATWVLLRQNPSR